MKSVSAKEYLDHRKDVSHKPDPTTTSIGSDRTLTSENASPATTTSQVAVNGISARRSIPRVLVAEKEATAAPKPPAAKVDKEISTSEAFVSVSDMADMRRLLSAATTADECRLIVDMFLAKNGVVTPSDPSKIKTIPSYSSPHALATEIKTQNEDIERSLVAALLGGADDDDEVYASEPEIASPSASVDFLEMDSSIPSQV